MMPFGGFWENGIGIRGKNCILSRYRSAIVSAACEGIGT